jgi:hypothetical protein
LWRRRDWNFAPIFLALIVILYLPYLGVGPAVLGFLGGYNAQEGIGSGTGIFLLAAFAQAVALPAYTAKLYLIVLAAGLFALGLRMVLAWSTNWSRQEAIRVIAGNCMLLGGILMVGVSPHYPWYYCWLLIPACIMPCYSVLYLVTASGLLYLNPTHTEVFWPALLYGPVFPLALLDLWAGRTPIALTHLKLAEGGRP